MTTHLIALAATALLVFGRAMQQQNVIHGHYLAAALTPFLIAAGEIAVVGAIVLDGWGSWPWIGAGGGLGAVAAMWLYRRIRPRPALYPPRPTPAGLVPSRPSGAVSHDPGRSASPRRNHP